MNIPVLTPVEEKIHQELAKNVGSVVSKNALEVAIYGNSKPLGANTNSVEVFIYRLRKKGFVIETERYSGYRLRRLSATTTSTPVETATP